MGLAVLTIQTALTIPTVNTAARTVRTRQRIPMQRMPQDSMTTTETTAGD
jgi:hypothetical protein